MNKFVCTLLFIISIFLLAIQIPDDPDFGINYRVGEYIFSHASVPRTDIFSFSLADHSYVYHSWLGQLIIFWVSSRIGLLGISLIWTAVATIAIYILYRLSTPSFWSFLAFLVATAVVFSSIGVRPQMFTFIFLVIELGVLLWWRSSLDETLNYKKRKKILWVLPLLFLLWANVHLGFIAGLIMFIVFVAGQVFFEIRVWGRMKNGRKTAFSSMISTIKNGTIVILASVLATLINPYGLDVYRQALAISRNPYNLTINREWMPLVARGAPHWILAGVVLVFLVFLFRRKTVNWTFAFLTLLFFWLTLRSTRTALVLLVVFLPWVSSYLYELPDPVMYFRKNRFNGFFTRSFIGLTFVLIPLAVINRGMMDFKILYSVTGSPKVLAARRSYPYGAVQFMKDNGVPTRMLNYFNWGGYLVWQISGIRVFETGLMDSFRIDRRLFLDDYFAIVNGKKDWDYLMEKYHINAILLPPDSALVQLLRNNPEWTVLYKDSVSTLMQKQSVVVTIKDIEYEL